MKLKKKLLLSIVIVVVAGFVMGSIAELLGMDNEGSWLSAISTGIIVFLICIYKFKVFKEIKEYIDDSDHADLYHIAEEEYDRGEMDKGLESQAYVKAKGDEKLRKVEYIKLRVKQLKKNK